jgi:hypothetical protein
MLRKNCLGEVNCRDPRESRGIAHAGSTTSLREFPGSLAGQKRGSRPCERRICEERRQGNGQRFALCQLRALGTVLRALGTVLNCCIIGFDDQPARCRFDGKGQYYMKSGPSPFSWCPTPFTDSSPRRGRFRATSWFDTFVSYDQATGQHRCDRTPTRVEIIVAHRGYQTTRATFQLAKLHSTRSGETEVFDLPAIEMPPCAGKN